MVPAEKIKTCIFLNKEICMNFEGINIVITRFTRIEDESAWEIPSHAHMNYELHYIYDGTGKIGLGNNFFEVSRGDFYICPPFIDHSQSADTENPMKEFCIECTLGIQETEDAECKQNDNSFLLQLIGRILYCKHSDSHGVLKRNFALLNTMFEEHVKLDEGEELLAKSLLLNTILSMLIYSKKDSCSNGFGQNRSDIGYQRASSIKNYLEANY